jgi:hypothetical protein
VKVIRLDARRWKTVLDFMGALRNAIGAPDWHGWSIDAFIDSMIWGGINTLEPPYTISIENAASLPDVVREEIDILSGDLRKHRQEFKTRNAGKDVEVTLEIAPYPIPLPSWPDRRVAA